MGLTLTLFKAGVLFVDYIQLALAANDFAIGAAALDTGSDSHRIFAVFTVIFI